MPIFDLIFAAILGATALDPVGASRLVIAPCDFDETYQYGSATCDIELQNSGDTDIHVNSISALRTGDTVGTDTLSIPAGGVAHISVRVSVGDDIGYSTHYFSLKTDEPGQPVRYSAARGFVSTVLDSHKPLIDFGVVDLSKERTSRSLVLSSREVDGLKIERVLESPPYYEVTIHGDGEGIDVKVNDLAPWGLFEKDSIVLRLNSEKQPKVSIKLKADFHGEIVPSLNPIPLGLMRTNAKNEFTVRLESRTGKKFKVGKLQLEGYKGTATVDDCIPPTPGCKQVRVRIADDQATGQIGGRLGIQLPDYGREISVYAWGMLLKPETEVVDLYEEMNKRQAAQGSESTAGSNSGADLGSVLRASVAKKDPSKVAPPPGKGPLVKWAVANEELLYGYAVYRSNDKDGPFARINENTILATGEGFYQWRDTSAVTGNTYWYYVGYLKRDGEKVQLTSPQEVTAK